MPEFLCNRLTELFLKSSTDEQACDYLGNHSWVFSCSEWSRSGKGEWQPTTGRMNPVLTERCKCHKKFLIHEITALEVTVQERATNLSLSMQLDVAQQGECMADGLHTTAPHKLPGVWACKKLTTFLQSEDRSGQGFQRNCIWSWTDLKWVRRSRRRFQFSFWENCTVEVFSRISIITSVPGHKTEIDFTCKFGHEYFLLCVVHRVFELRRISDRYSKQFMILFDIFCALFLRLNDFMWRTFYTIKCGWTQKVFLQMKRPSIPAYSMENYCQCAEWPTSVHSDTLEERSFQGIPWSCCGGFFEFVEYFSCFYAGFINVSAEFNDRK